MVAVFNKIFLRLKIVRKLICVDIICLSQSIKLRRYQYGGEKVNRSDRILSIFVRLMKGQRINKALLSDEMNVDKRTIQRDIDDIRSHFYDSEEYGGQRLEVTYSHLDNCYYLDGNITHADKHTFKYLLIMIRSLTHTLSKDIYQLLESLILTQYKRQSSDLFDILSSFTISSVKIPYENIDQFMSAHKESHSLYHYEKQAEMMPLSLSYKSGEFSAYLLNKNRIEEHNLTHTNITSTETTSNQKIQQVTFEIERNYWDTFKESISVYSVETMTEEIVIATFNIGVDDAIGICFNSAPYIRLISPSHLKKLISDKLIEMNKVYIHQSVFIQK